MVIRGVDMLKNTLTSRIFLIFFNEQPLRKNEKDQKTKLSTGFKNRVNRAAQDGVEKVLIKECTDIERIKRIKPH
jgi:hypothetical protein